MPAPLSETWGGDFLGKSVHNKWRAVDTSWYTLSPPSRFVWVKKAFRETDYPMFKTKKKNFNLDQNHCLLRRTYIHSLTIGSCISTMRPVECVYNLKMRDRYADDERGQEFFIQMVAIFATSSRTNDEQENAAILPSLQGISLFQTTQGVIPLGRFCSFELTFCS